MTIGKRQDGKTELIWYVHRTTPKAARVLRRVVLSPRQFEELVAKLRANMGVDA